MEILYGIIAGIVASLGMGGGTILILLLSMFTEFNQHIAQGTNLIFFIPTAITAGIINSKRNLIDKKLVVKYSILGGIGAIVGAYLASFVNSDFLKKYFGYFLLLIAFYEIYEFLSSIKKSNKEKINL